MTTRYSRESIVTFTQSYVDNTGDPIVPVDTTYPAVQIEDPNGTIVASGVGTATTVPGLWQFEWSVPVNAEVSDSWKIVWMLVDGQHDSHERTEAFGVSAKVEEQTALERSGWYLVMLGTTERLIWKGTYNPIDIMVTLERADETVLLEATKTQMAYTAADCYHYYTVDTPTLGTECDHLVTWRVRESAITTWEYQVQHLKVPYRSFWLALPHLRFLVDKLNKIQTTPLSYLDIELHMCLERGLELLNSVHPLTYWTWNGVPTQFGSWWILCAGLWCLNSRQLLEIEVSHTLSGQTVTLEYDHTSGLGEVMSRWQEMIRDWLMPAKLAAYRQSAGPGVVAVRPYRLGYPGNYRPYRIMQSNNFVQDFPVMLDNLGLYP